MIDQMNFDRLRGNVKTLSAALGVGVVITMGALTFTYQAGSGGTSSETWKADTTTTLTPSAAPRSVAPTLKASFCENDSPHAWIDGCPWAAWAPAK